MSAGLCFPTHSAMKLAECMGHPTAVGEKSGRLRVDVSQVSKARPGAPGLSGWIESGLSRFEVSHSFRRGRGMKGARDGGARTSGQSPTEAESELKGLAEGKEDLAVPSVADRDTDRDEAERRVGNQAGDDILTEEGSVFRRPDLTGLVAEGGV
jgi:hypothetical protein